MNRFIERHCSLCIAEGCRVVSKLVARVLIKFFAGEFIWLETNEFCAWQSIDELMEGFCFPFQLSRAYLQRRKRQIRVEVLKKGEEILCDACHSSHGIQSANQSIYGSWGVLKLILGRGFDKTEKQTDKNKEYAASLYWRFPRRNE